MNKKSTISTQVSIRNQIEAHFATLRTVAPKACPANWQVYAAVAGSALAAATNASAGIIHSNTVVTAGPIGNVLTGNVSHYRTIALGHGGALGLYVSQNAYHGVEKNNEFGYAGLFNPFFTSGRVEFGRGSASDSVRIGMQAGYLIAPGNFQNPGNYALVAGAFRATTTSGSVASGLNAAWGPEATGLAAFRFLNTDTQQTNYGWIRLAYTLGDNSLPNSITALEWAYEDTGNFILAGDTGAAVPEPSSAAMAILAAGAAGVTALRRRRKSEPVAPAQSETT